MSVDRTLGRAALVVSAGILGSRLLGFLRDVVIAGLLGRTAEADLYVAAFLVPDYLYFLMAGGYLSITLVPILARHYAAGDDDAARRAFTAVFRIVAGPLMLLTATSMALAGPLVGVVFPEVANQARLADLTRIALASQIFFGMGTLLMAAQYARQRFLVPTLAPLIYNLGIIVGGLVGAGLGEPSPEAFLWGGLAGAALGNFALQWWGARRVGTTLVGDVPWRHPAVPAYLGMAIPLMIGQSVVALDEQWPRFFGQFVSEGATAGLSYARRLTMLPVGVIAQAAGVAAYPFLARLHAEGRPAELHGTVVRSVRTAVAVAGLAAAVTAGLAFPIVRIAFQRGEFTAADTAFTAPLLAVYAASIPFWAAHQVYTRAFYARRKMWLPVGIGTGLTTLTVPGLIWAVTTRGAMAVAAVSAASVAAYAVTVGLWWHRRQPAGSEALGRVPLATLMATLAAGSAAALVAAGIDGPGLPRSLATLVAGGVVAGGVYLAVARLAGMRELERLATRWLRRREVSR